MISSLKLKAIGIVAAILTLGSGVVLSNVGNGSAAYSAAAFTATVFFAVWVLCAAVLLVRLCKWLYASRTSRSGLKSILWIAVIVWAPIVVPLIVRLPAGHDLSRAKG